MKFRVEICVFYLIFHISKSHFFRDNIPTVVLQKWPLQAILFDEQVLAGPVPLLFADDQDISRENMLADMGRLHVDINCINRAFFAPEYINLKDALALINAPR
jgi:hypothetical protein